MLLCEDYLPHVSDNFLLDLEVYLELYVLQFEDVVFYDYFWVRKRYIGYRDFIWSGLCALYPIWSSLSQPCSTLFGDSWSTFLACFYLCSAWGSGLPLRVSGFGKWFRGYPTNLSSSSTEQSNHFCVSFREHSKHFVPIFTSLLFEAESFRWSSRRFAPWSISSHLFHQYARNRCKLHHYQPAPSHVYSRFLVICPCFSCLFIYFQGLCCLEDVFLVLRSIFVDR